MRFPNIIKAVQQTGHQLSHVMAQGKAVLQNQWQPAKQALSQSRLNGQKVKQWINVGWPYTPLLAFPSFFGKILPRGIDNYRRNQGSRDFTRQFAVTSANPTPANVGRLNQQYFNYHDRLGLNPVLMPPEFMAQRGLHERWSAWMFSNDAPNLTRVTLPAQSPLTRHYPTVFSAVF